MRLLRFLRILTIPESFMHQMGKRSKLVNGEINNERKIMAEVPSIPNNPLKRGIEFTNKEIDKAIDTGKKALPTNLHDLYSFSNIST